MGRLESSGRWSEECQGTHRAHPGWTTCPLGEAQFPLSGAKSVFFLIPVPRTWLSPRLQAPAGSTSRAPLLPVAILHLQEMVEGRTEGSSTPGHWNPERWGHREGVAWSPEYSSGVTALGHAVLISSGVTALGHAGLISSGVTVPRTCQSLPQWGDGPRTRRSHF